MEKHSQNQRERLSYLEFRVYFTGQINRSDLIERFGISEAAATRDLAIYRKEAPGNVVFDPITKFYRIGENFMPHFIKNVASKDLLRALVHGIGDDFGGAPEVLVPVELPIRLHAPDASVLATVSRAIFGQHVLRVGYLSGSGSHGERDIVPFAFSGTGLKWQIRAYDRKNCRFSHFLVNRINSAEVLRGVHPLAQELKEFDDDWNRMVKMEIVAHPDRPTDKAMTELEYQMHDGVLHMKVRAALAGSVLRLWDVDCSPDHRLGNNFYRLWLRNSIALHDVSSAEIAPGYSTSSPDVLKRGVGGNQ